MTREQFEDMEFEELMNWANSNLNSITNEELLKEYAIEKIQDDNFSMGLHIINAIYENPYSTEWYRYDYSMGTLETPTPITDKEDIEDLMNFDDEE
jgi:hypothetical protein